MKNLDEKLKLFLWLFIILNSINFLVSLFNGKNMINNVVKASNLLSRSPLTLEIDGVPVIKIPIEVANRIFAYLGAQELQAWACANREYHDLTALMLRQDKPAKIDFIEEDDSFSDVVGEGDERFLLATQVDDLQLKKEIIYSLVRERCEQVGVASAINIVKKTIPDSTIASTLIYDLILDLIKADEYPDYLNDSLSLADHIANDDSLMLALVEIGRALSTYINSPDALLNKIFKVGEHIKEREIKSKAFETIANLFIETQRLDKVAEAHSIVQQIPDLELRLSMSRKIKSELEKLEAQYFGTFKPVTLYEENPFQNGQLEYGAVWRKQEKAIKEQQQQMRDLKEFISDSNNIF